MKHEGIIIVFFVLVFLMPAVVVYRVWGTAFSGLKRAKPTEPKSSAGNAKYAADNEATTATQEQSSADS
jgi:hypothetical protein